MSDVSRRLLDMVPPFAEPSVILALSTYHYWKTPMVMALIVVVWAGVTLHVEMMRDG